MKPKFTDGHRFPAGYTPSHETDIRKTFERAKRRLEQNTAERALKVREFKGVKK